MFPRFPAFSIPAVDEVQLSSDDTAFWNMRMLHYIKSECCCADWQEGGGISEWVEDQGAKAGNSRIWIAQFRKLAHWVWSAVHVRWLTWVFGSSFVSSSSSFSLLFSCAATHALDVMSSPLCPWFRSTCIPDHPNKHCRELCCLRRAKFFTSRSAAVIPQIDD